MAAPSRAPQLGHLLRQLLLPSPLPYRTVCSPPHLPLLRFFSTTTSSSSSSSASPPTSDLAREVSAELLKLPPSSSSSDIQQMISRHFSQTRFSPSLFREVVLLSPTAGRPAVHLFRHLAGQRDVHPSDSTLALLVHLLGRRYDFKAVNELLSDFRATVGPETLAAIFSRLSAAGRPSQAVRFFDSLENDIGVPRDRAALASLVGALTDRGFTGYAERAVKSAADEIFPDLEICYALIKGYSSELKLGEAQRLMAEMQCGGFDVSTPSYNSLLDCICRLCRKKDPLRLLPEAESFLLEMESAGIPRNPETFHILIYNLCKIRKTEDAMKLFRRIGEWGCLPEADTYLTLIRSLYQAARISEGDEMINWMRVAGFSSKLDRKAYYGFIKILCGIERVEHAMKVFRMMKGYGHAPGIKTYDLLIGKLAAHYQVDRANALFKEAAARGVAVIPKAYRVDPRYAKVKVKKMEKKRETLPEKMARKRKKLRKLARSFVKKPRSARRVIG